MRQSPLLALAAAVLIAFPAGASACSFSVGKTVSPATYNTFSGVAGSAPTDVWAVGRGSVGSNPSLTLIEHFNGQAWSVVTSPSPFQSGNYLLSVASVSKTDAWAVGYGLEPSGGFQSLVLHWDGKTWSASKAAAVKGRLTIFYAVTALAADDIWAVGESTDLSGNDAAPLTEHYSGKSWGVKTSPNLGSYGSILTAVSGTAVNDVWAFGGTGINASVTSFTTFTLHWNGTKWSVVPSPNVNANNNVLNAGVAISPTDAWGIGDYWTGSAFAPLTLHWDGGSWKIVKSPQVGVGGDGVAGATAFSSTDVWAVGEEFIGSNSDTLALKWNGKSWTHVKSPNLPGGNPTVFRAAAAIPGSTTLWAVGSNSFPSSGSPDLTLAASLTCADDQFLDDSLTSPGRFTIPRGLIRPPGAR